MYVLGAVIITHTLKEAKGASLAVTHALGKKKKRGTHTYPERGNRRPACAATLDAYSTTRLLLLAFLLYC
jgi:hypothetical protein